jgi:hypothetical protein
VYEKIHFSPTPSTVGRVDIGIRTTIRLGKVHFVAKVCKICLKTFLVPLAASSQVYTFRVMQYIWVKNVFLSQYRVYGYQKTQNFT